MHCDIHLLKPYTARLSNYKYNYFCRVCLLIDRHIKGKIYIGHAESEISIFHPDECKPNQYYCMHPHIYVLMRNEKDARKKQAMIYCSTTYSSII